MNRPVHRSPMLYVGMLAMTICIAGGRCIAERPALNAIDPRFFGLRVPPGRPVRGTGERVLTSDQQGNSVVAKVHVTVGDDHIVLLPDGELAARRRADAPSTERRFEPIEKKLLADRLTKEEFRGFSVKETRRYLYVYNSSEEFAVATSRIMETMFPGIVLHAQAQKIPVSPPEVPMVVIMFATEEEFQGYRRMPPGVVAYYSPVTNRVVMYEKSSRTELKPELAIQRAISTIAHEGAHQVLHNIGVQQRLSVWPMWLSEGLAEYFAPTTTGARLRWKGAGQVNDVRMFELERYLKLASADGLNGETIEATTQAARLTSTGYASAWMLTHFLAKNQRAKLNDFVRDMSKLGPLEGWYDVQEPGIIPDNLTIFKEYFGADLADMERRLMLHVKRLPYSPPFADFPHYVAMVSYPNGRREARNATMFISAEHADQWLNEVISKLPAAQQTAAKSQIRQCPNRSVAVRVQQQWLTSH